MLKASLRLTLRSLNLMSRIALAGATLIILLVAGLLLSLRYWVLPNIERYHNDISSSVSKAIGLPVSIGAIEADWSGLLPHLRLTDVRVLDASRQGQVALALQHVDGVVSWLTLVRGEVRLHSLQLDKPDLQIRRDAHGVLYVAGIPLSGQSADTGLMDWLLHQSNIMVRDARITWDDQLRAAPPLVFDQLNLNIENRFRHHRFALRALPPPELSGMLDVRGDFSGRHFNELSSWRGQLYAQLEYADVGAWRTWLKLPSGFKHGRGALRGWLDVAQGKVSQVTADLALADVQAQLGAALPLLNLRTLRGRVSWKKSAAETEVTTRKLALMMSNGLKVRPTDFFLRYATNAEGKQPYGEIRANSLELADLADLTDYLPLEKNLKQQLAEFSPQGEVSNLHAKWQSDATEHMHYEVDARFDRLSMKRTDKLPGFSGLSGEVSGTDSGGKLTLSKHALTVDAPQYMPEALAFDAFSGRSSWQSTPRGLEIKFSDVSAANADLAGTVSGSFLSVPGTPGVIELNISLARAAVQHADRYIPLDALDKQTHDWLRSALVAGQADNFQLQLKGDLKDFPFPENKKGLFRIRSHINGLVLEYDKSWPRIENGIANLDILGTRLEVNAPVAMTMGTALQKVDVVVDDLNSPDMLLQIRGEATGETERSLEFIRNSPVRGYIDGVTDGAHAQGNGTLHLSVDVPLRGSKAVKVKGRYSFTDNELNLGDGIPVLYKMNGDLSFTESSFNMLNAKAQILGGPATISVQSGKDGLIQARLSGRTDIDALRQNISDPLLEYLHGGSDWQAEVKTQKKLTDVLVTSDLVGLACDMPVPFNKQAEEVIPLRFELRSVMPQQDVVVVQYGKLAGVKLFRRKQADEWVIKRGSVNFGGLGKWPNHDGVWFTGILPKMALGGWGMLAGSSGKALPFNIAGANLLIQNLDAYGHSITGLRVNMLNQAGVYVAQLASREVNGEVSWDSQGKGKLTARLKNLILGEKDSSRKHVSEHKPTAAATATNPDFPALDITVDDLTWKDKQLGKMELMAKHKGADWLVDRMLITNPDGVLTVDGKWSMEGGQARTQGNMKLEISDAGAILSRSGYPNSVKHGSGKLEAEFAWPGGPEDFDYAALDGTLKLDAAHGQFLKIEPGIGKLLGILSLQALPRHITLDFTDVFSNGFAFDSINGTAQIKQGVMTTDDFRIDGSSAKVTMKGQVDLGHETQDLRIRILPTVGNSISLIGALAISPITGIGAFIINKILREPLDKLASFEYNVTGTWADPNVVKVNK